ncbi:MAG: hypothetical protein FWF02_08740 [Micrococcales bacterium]|nr:hypothetical protein [Micrococcales bacterium]MCL2667775.1 hypothetical protein [Micrococcales bacterium]
MISLEQVSGNASGSKAAVYIGIVSALSAVFFFVTYVLGSVFIAQNMLPRNDSFSAKNVDIVTLSQQEGASTKGLERDLTEEEVAALTAKAVEIGKKLNLEYLRIELVNDKCPPRDSDDLCEQRLTAYNDVILDEALGTTSHNRRSGPEGVTYVMDIQDPVPFTWITSHGRTADNFFTSRVKNRIFETSRQRVPLGTDRLVYHRMDVMLDRSIYELRSFGVFSPFLMVVIFLISAVAITIFFLVIRKRYSISWAVQSGGKIAAVAVDVSQIQRTVTGTRTSKTYNPPQSSSSSSGFSSGGGGGGGGGGSSSGGGRG